MWKESASWHKPRKSDNKVAETAPVIAPVFSRRGMAARNKLFAENIGEIRTSTWLQDHIGGWNRLPGTLLNSSWDGTEQVLWNRLVARDARHRHLENAEMISLVQGDAHQLPFQDCSFDLVCCRNLLKHCSNPTMVTGEMHRVVKHEGRVLIVESCAFNEADREFMNRVIGVAEPDQKTLLDAG